MDKERSQLIIEIKELANIDRTETIKRYQKGSREAYYALASAFYDKLESQGINTSADKAEPVRMFMPCVLSPNERRKPEQTNSKLIPLIFSIAGFVVIVAYVINRIMM